MDSKLTKNNSIGLKVSGNIISELSDRIPNHFIALNELIKNSYDADANLVEIKVSSEQQTISVIDNGKGMTEEEMEKLLHIARSNKEYANKRENGRITQGEKGLGTLAAFHFGDIVEWETSTNGSIGHKFSIDKSKVINYDDVTRYDAIVQTTPVVSIGTKVLMYIKEKDQFEFLLNTLRDKKVSEKVARAIYASDILKYDSSNFKILLYIDGKLFIEDDFDQMEKYYDDRTYRVTYDSGSDSLIKYYYEDKFLFHEKFVLSPVLSEFRIKCDLDIYDFGSGSKYKSKDFPGLFKKQQEIDSITPLVYINQGLFNNYTLFDTNLVRAKRSSESLPQITGEIEIESSSEDLQFNSDRTEINENIVTTALKNEMNNLNTKIQTVGSKFKEPFIDLNRNKEPRVIKNKVLTIKSNSEQNIKKQIKENIIHDMLSKFITYDIEDGKVKYYFFNEEIEVELNITESDENEIRKRTTKRKTKIKPAKIILTRKKENFIIPSKQINLFEYVKSEETLDSYGNPIPLEDIKVQSNAHNSIYHGILPTVIEEAEYTINYIFNDDRTGNVSESLRLKFTKEPSIKMVGESKKSKLIHTHGIGNFKINYDTTVSRLINQLNSLDVGEYLEVISVCLRPLIELSVNYLKNIQSESQSIKDLSSKLNQTRDLSFCVRKIFNFIEINNNMSFVTEYLAKDCTNVSYNTLRNILNTDEMVKSSSQTNLGSHNSTKNLSEKNIISIAHDISYFLIIVEGIHRGKNSNKWEKI